MKRRAASLLRQRLQGLLREQQASPLTTNASPARFGAGPRLPAASGRSQPASQTRGAAMPAVAQVGPGGRSFLRALLALPVIKQHCRSSVGGACTRGGRPGVRQQQTGAQQWPPQRSRSCGGGWPLAGACACAVFVHKLAPGSGPLTYLSLSKWTCPCFERGRALLTRGVSAILWLLPACLASSQLSCLPPALPPSRWWRRCRPRCP